MRLLLDTHAFLWFVLGDSLLCDYAKSLILDTDNHRDPFDRLLVAQALGEDIPLVSADSILDAYGIKRLW
ncbi:MAG: hypothetical protein WD847_11800 [Pirellulales bacterium]